MTLLTTIITLTKCFLLAFTIVKFDPLWMIVETLPENLILPGSRKWILTALRCLSCITFWTTLIVTRDIWLASLMYYLASIYTKTLMPWHNKITLQ
jgi:hypothetical protein